MGSSRLVVNFGDPTPGIGWRGTERPALTERSKTGVGTRARGDPSPGSHPHVPTAAILDFFYHLDAEVVLEVPAESDQMVKELKSHKARRYP